MRPVVHRNYETQCPRPRWWTTATTVVWGTRKSLLQRSNHSPISYHHTHSLSHSHTFRRDEASVVGECVFPSPAYGVCLDSETCIYCNESARWAVSYTHLPYYKSHEKEKKKTIGHILRRNCHQKLFIKQKGRRGQGRKRYDVLVGLTSRSYKQLELSLIHILWIIII